MNRLVPTVWARCIVGEVPRSSAVQSSLERTSSTGLCGAASAQLADRLASCRQDDRLGRYQLLSDYFAMPGAAHTLWQLAAACASHAQGGSGKLICTDSQIQHVSCVRASLLSQANQLELTAGGKGYRGLGAAKKEDALHEAALLHLQAGNIEQCCELLVKVCLGVAGLYL